MMMQGPANVKFKQVLCKTRTDHNQSWLSLNRRYIAGCTSYMLLIVTVNTIAECLRADCIILGDKKSPFSPILWQSDNHVLKALIT